jgi:hypothetical protein
MTKWSTAQKCIWASYLYTLAQKYKLSDKVLNKLVEIYLDGE